MVADFEVETSRGGESEVLGREFHMFESECGCTCVFLSLHHIL